VMRGGGRGDNDGIDVRRFKDVGDGADGADVGMTGDGAGKTFGLSIADGDDGGAVDLAEDACIVRSPVAIANEGDADAGRRRGCRQTAS